MVVLEPIFFDIWRDNNPMGIIFLSEESSFLQSSIKSCKFRGSCSFICSTLRAGEDIWSVEISSSNSIQISFKLKQWVIDASPRLTEFTKKKRQMKFDWLYLLFFYLCQCSFH